MIVEEKHWISATQLDVYRACPRKWAWQWVEGFRPPKQASAQLGSDVHAVLENYSKTGVLKTDDKAGLIAAAGVKHLPLPSTPGLQVEQRFQFETDIAIYNGLMDLHWIVGDVSNVHDHKTTSDFKWAKSEEDLRTDAQAVLYAVAALINDGTKAVDLTWLYYLTNEKKPRTKKVHLRVYPHELDAEFEKIEIQSAEMVSHKLKGRRALDLDFNISHCSAYGGCAFVSKCNLSASEIARSIYMQASLADKLKNKLKGNNGAAEEAPAAAETKTETKATETKPEGSSSKMADKLKARTGKVNSPEGEATVKNGTPATSAPATAAAVAAAPVVNVAAPNVSVNIPISREDFFTALLAQGLLAGKQCEVTDVPEIAKMLAEELLK